MARHNAIKAENYSTDWDKDIAELKQYFESTLLPSPPIKLNQYSTIMDLSLFIEGHFAILETYKGERIGLPYLHRLQELRQFLIALNNINHIEDG